MSPEDKKIAIDALEALLRAPEVEVKALVGAHRTRGGLP